MSRFLYQLICLFVRIIEVVKRLVLYLYQFNLKKKTDNVRTKATMWRICVTFCCRAKETSINYSECMSVVLFTSKQSECAELYYYLWSAQQRHIFPHYLTSGKSFGEKIY